MKLWKFYSFGDDYSMSECNSIDPNDDCEYYADVEEALRAERELTTLRQELGAADWDSLKQRAETAESECATLRTAVREKERLELAACAEADELRAEVGRLRAELELESELVTLHAGGASRAESRLAAANELLHLARGYHDGVDAQIYAFLAAQPAAPTCKDCGGQLTVMPDGFGEAFTCAHCDQPAEPARTEAEPVDCESCAMRGRECDNGDHCDNCGNRMDGDIAATADVCHDCWRAAKARTEAEPESDWEREQRFWSEHPIERFDLDECGSGYMSYRDMRRNETGDWIRSDDHRAAVERAELARREAAK